METFYRNFLAQRRKDVNAFRILPVYPGSADPGIASKSIVFQFCVVREMLLALESIDLMNLDCTCPKMTASDEWHFLCAPHPEKPRECCAIDYMKHTIDSATSLLLALGCQSQNVAKHYHSVLRRLYRIYGHLYFHHNEVFEQQRFHCQRMYLFLKEWDLFKQDMMIIPESVFEGGGVTSKRSFSPKEAADSSTMVDLRSVTMQLSTGDYDT